MQPSAWRFPTPATALIGAFFLHKRLTVQSRGRRDPRVDWAQSAALLVRRDAARDIGWFDPQFFVYSDEVDFCRRLADAGWHTLWVPGAEAVHHEQLSTGAVPERRIVELSRNRDRYMRKHHSAAAAFIVRLLTAWAYVVRALIATIAPGHDPKRYWSTSPRPSGPTVEKASAKLRTSSTAAARRSSVGRASCPRCWVRRRLGDQCVAPWSRAAWSDGTEESARSGTSRRCPSSANAPERVTAPQGGSGPLRRDGLALHGPTPVHHTRGHARFAARIVVAEGRRCPPGVRQHVKDQRRPSGATRRPANRSAGP